MSEFQEFGNIFINFIFLESRLSFLLTSLTSGRPTGAGRYNYGIRARFEIYVNPVCYVPTWFVKLLLLENFVEVRFLSLLVDYRP